MPATRLQALDPVTQIERLLRCTHTEAVDYVRHRSENQRIAALTALGRAALAAAKEPQK